MTGTAQEHWQSTLNISDQLFGKHIKLKSNTFYLSYEPSLSHEVVWYVDFMQALSIMKLPIRLSSGIHELCAIFYQRVWVSSDVVHVISSSIVVYAISYNQTFAHMYHHISNPFALSSSASHDLKFIPNFKFSLIHSTFRQIICSSGLAHGIHILLPYSFGYPPHVYPVAIYSWFILVEFAYSNVTSDFGHLSLSFQSQIRLAWALSMR